METSSILSWEHDNKPIELIPDDAIGFVYLITNLLDSRKYIGKKKFVRKVTKLKTVTLKSGEKKKKKIRSVVESDWQDYYGSSAELLADIEKLGKENFKRVILRICYKLGELTYYEAKFQFESDCLLKPTEYYNGWIMAKVRRSHLLTKDMIL